MKAPALPLIVTVVACLGSTAVSAQQNAEVRGSANIEVVAHIPLGGPGTVSDIEIEQDLARPYAYVGREVRYSGFERGMDVIDLSDPARPKVIHRWRIEDGELHVGLGGKDLKYFKWNGRHYVLLSVEFGQGGPDADLGAIVFDVTDLPGRLQEVARIRLPGSDYATGAYGTLGGMHNIHLYRHSNGRPLLFATVTGPYASVYDLGHVLDGRMDEALVARVPIPESEAVQGARGYHDFFIGYHPDSEQDRFYGGGTGGYYVYNVTDLENPELLVSLTGINGVEGGGHTFTPSPDGRYAIAEVEYQYAPLRVFDLKPGLDGEVANINRPIAAWTANWEHIVHNHEVRWPYVFVSGYWDGLQVFSMQDPRHPKTIAHYDTFLEQADSNIFNGAWGIDVRNADGLIVISDMSTGFWAFRMEGFGGWNGLDHGVPNISSVQDWDRGPAVQAVTR